MTYFKVIEKGKKKHYSIIKPGKHIFFIYNYSGELQLDITTKDAEVYIFGLYIGKNNENFKLNTVQHHLIGESISDLLIKGVFFDSSKFVYEGLIRIDKHAQKSNAYQKNQNLIMSPNVFVDSRPFLEILANDVRCTHGSTTGKLNKDEILYLQTRGLNKKQSEKLILEGFIFDLFNRMNELGDSAQLANIKKRVLENFN